MDRTLAPEPTGGNIDRAAPPPLIDARREPRGELTRRAFGASLAAGLFLPLAGSQAADRTLALTAMVGGEGLTLGSDARFAGAISSLRYRGKEYVEASDHGRLFQGAVQFGGYGEALNPTQAGGSRDRVASSSRLLRADVGGDLWNVTTQAAYWLRPGDAWTPPGQRPHRAVNRTRLSDTLITQRHRFDGGRSSRAVAAQAVFTLAAAQSVAVVEAFTLYAPAEFSRFHAFRDGVLTPDLDVRNDPGERPWPTVVSTEDGAHAFALRSAGPRAVGYGRGRFDDCSKLNIVFRPADGLPAGSTSFGAAWTIGSLAEVEATLRALSASLDTAATTGDNAR